MIPYIASLISHAVARRSIKRARVIMAHFYDQPTLHLLQHGGSFDVCIDNIRYCGSKELLSWAVHTTATTCRELDISTNPPGYPEEKYDFLGVGYDHSNGTVSLGLKIRNKVEALVIPEGGSSTPLSVMLSILGVLVHASHILHLPLVRYYYFYKCVRRRAAMASGVHDIVSWWAAAARDAEQWRSHRTPHTPTPLPQRCHVLRHGRKPQRLGNRNLRQRDHEHLL